MYNKKLEKSCTYKSKENDTVIRLIEKDGEIDELHIAISGEKVWTVIGYSDFKNAISKAEKKFRKKTSHDYGGGYIGEALFNLEE